MKGVATTEGSSGFAVILLTPDGQNRILIAAGANALLSPDDVSRHAALFEQARLLVCQLEVPLETVEAAISLAASRDIPVLLNPAPARTLPAGLFRRIDYLIPNETEASLLTGTVVRDQASANEAAGLLIERGARNVIVTLGALGIVIADSRGYRHMPALPADVVDTTAAGDSFIGGFAAGISEGLSIDEAAQLGLRVARICVGRRGAQASLPHRHEL